MIQPAETGNALHNRILSALPKEEYGPLASHFEFVELPLGKILYQPEEPIHHVYFPLHGTISLTVMMENGSEAEVGVIGQEGMLGLPIILGTDTAPLKAVVQVPDGGIRIKADVFGDEVLRCAKLRRLLLRYAQAFFVQAAVTAACNGLHQLDGRMAKWLLMCQDRAQSDTLKLTHEFMAIMLGVRRAGVTLAAGKLQKDGLIEYRRGQVRILDRKGLESVSCECYEIVKKEFDRLLQ